MKKNLLIVATLIATFYACGVKSAQKSDAKASDTTAALTGNLAKGKELYMGACGKCHPAFDVKSKPIDRWHAVLEPMIVDKAKMAPADGKLVEAYVWHELGVSGK